MKTTMVVAAMVVVVVLYSTTVSSQPSTSGCFVTLLSSCNDTNSSMGMASCCKGISTVANTDLPCLCSLFRAANFSRQNITTLLTGCSIRDVTDTTCTDLSGSPTSTQSPPPPSLPPASESLPSPPPPSSLLPSGGFNGTSISSSKSSTSLVVGVVVGVIIVLLFLLIFFIIIWRKRKNRTKNTTVKDEPRRDKMEQPLDVFINPKITFTYDDLAVATGGFADSNLLGQGGFGFVHKGFLRNGQEVAVKQLKTGSMQGEREFRAEVEIISRVHHKHLVSLVGYCITEDKRLLVYEFLPNNTLDFHLHGRGRPPLSWSTRMKVALGSAKGLAYLHEDCHPKIIHRDIKSSNILLDFNFEAKVADFGLAKFCSDNAIHVTTRIVGTIGYLAPEYASTGHLTDKSDVFSFGMMLLELITGRRPIEKHGPFVEKSLLDWAMPLMLAALEENDYDALADPRLHKSYDTNEMARVVACAAACVQLSARRRPQISQVVRILEGQVSVDDLSHGLKHDHDSLYGLPGFSDNESRQHISEKKRLEQGLFSSGDYTSSDYSGATSGTTSEHPRTPAWSSSEVRRV